MRSKTSAPGVQKIKTISLSILTLFLLSHQYVFAGTVNANTIKAIEEQSFWVKIFAGFIDASPGAVVAHIITAFLGLLGIIYIILTMQAGFLWMTAGGNSAQVEKAKQSLSRSVIGLIIIFSAFSIMLFVFKNLPI